MDLRKESPTYDRTLGSIEEAGKLFMETGFFEAHAAPKDDSITWSQRWRRHSREHPISSVTLSKVMRQVARELKRPIIICETDYFHAAGARTIVKLRRSKRNSPLVAQFFLLDEISRYDSNRKKAGVYRGQDGTNWHITFLGDEGQKVFRDWQKHCATDPICRAALKLPPLPDKVTSLAA